MKLWRIELDQEEAWLLSRFMESAKTAVGEKRPLKSLSENSCSSVSNPGTSIV
jgi:hypothetical protein